MRDVFPCLLFLIWCHCSSANSVLQSQTVTRVIDGDTIVVRDDQGVETTVRLIGVDAYEIGEADPEHRYWARRARWWLGLQLVGQAVRLEGDPLCRPTDRYGRRLAYVVRINDDWPVNTSIIEQGYARAYCKYRFSREDAFLDAELEPGKMRVGVWSGVIPAPEHEQSPRPSGGP